MRRWLLTLGAMVFLGASAFGQIPKPDDAPQPLPPDEAVKQFKLPPGLKLELVASEPLVREPSGVCWDEQGRLFVCELHGYNVDGQIDVDELNKTGKLDKVVRRFFVPQHVEEAAKELTFGTIKLLSDSDGDGRMDKAQVFADKLPACFGICAARGGIVVVGAPDITFLADRDGDGAAEVREVLFTGFPTGVLDRRMGNPQWGLDDWIYVGRAHGAAKITGPNLAKAVKLPNTDFRIKADGSAIEPVSGEVSGLGFTFTEAGDRFVSSVGWPANLVVPLPWHSLARNPFVATPPLSMQVFPDRRVYPTSQPHPWRTKRSEDPGFSKFYTDGWGIAESAPNGYFTSCCGPLVYQDGILPSLRGQLLACEPAQNLIHRSLIARDGLVHRLKRAKGEESSEFLTSTDAWFHPIALSHGPDGCVWITDFYREIIEDYSAIPRYLQQQYGVTNGKDHGRIWRIAPVESRSTPAADMSRLTPSELAQEVASPLHWRRETARRLIVERKLVDSTAALKVLALESKQTSAIINALHTLDEIDQLPAELLVSTMKQEDAGVRRQSLQLAEQRFESEPLLLETALALADDSDPLVRLQVALSLGASRDARVMASLAKLARSDGDAAWMATAILAALPDRGGRLLAELLADPSQLENAKGLLEPLCAAIAARRNEQELSDAFVLVAEIQQESTMAACLRGLRKSFAASVEVPLNQKAREDVKSLAKSENAEVRSLAAALVRLMRLETATEHDARVAAATKQLYDATATAEQRLTAVGELSEEEGTAVASKLVEALPTATPRLREAIMDALFRQRDRLPVLLDAIENKAVTPSLLSAVQRNQLLNDRDKQVRARAKSVLASVTSDSLALFPQYAEALSQSRDVANGQKVFKETCGKCHQAHGIGVAVGPDLSSEFQRAEETIIKDILAPSETISSGYMTYSVATTAGHVFNGLLASESPTSVTLKLPEGKQQVILRNEIEELRVSPISMMPEDLAKQTKPKDVADVIAWLRQPQRNVVLLDDNHNLAVALNEGAGTAEFTTSDKFSGEASLMVTPPQRFSPRIRGWNFPIRENPAVGEYRYVRFAWKAPKASGVMIEWADDGKWPLAEETTRRYFAGKNLTAWQAVGIAPRVPSDWTVMTRDLWKDFGDFTLTGFAPTAIEGPAMFDRIELLRELEQPENGEK
jgi:putative membrane-bound dehydrogenase-like protein